MIPSKWPIPAEPRIASHRTLTTPHFCCQVEQTQTSRLSEESSLPRSLLPVSETLLLLLRRNSIYCLMWTDRLSSKDCQMLCVNNPHFNLLPKCDLIKMKTRGVRFPPRWGGRMKTTCVNRARCAALSVRRREETVIRLVSCDKQ